MKRVGIALGVVWAVGCLLLSLGSYSSNRPQEVLWGLAIGGLPWGIWWLLRGFENWHRIVVGFLGIVALVAVLICGMSVLREHNEEAERLASYTRVPVNQVELVEPRLAEPKGRAPRILARVRNRNDRHTVTALELAIRFHDCPVEHAPLKICEIVADPLESVEVRVPPLQSRDILHEITVPDTYVIRGHMQWSGHISRVRASPP